MLAQLPVQRGAADTEVGRDLSGDRAVPDPPGGSGAGGRGKLRGASAAQRAGARVDADGLLGDCGGPHRVDLPREVLGGGADPALGEIHTATGPEFDAVVRILTHRCDTSF